MKFDFLITNHIICICTFIVENVYFRQGFIQITVKNSCCVVYPVNVKMLIKALIVKQNGDIFNRVAAFNDIIR